MRTVIKIFYVIWFLLPIACSKSASPAADDAAKDTSYQVPELTDARKDLVLSWYVDGGPEVGSSVSDVPEAARKEVRVQDPSIPPEKAAPDTVYIADLTAPKVGGKYVVKAVPREAFEAKRRAAEEKAEKEQAAALAASAPPTPGNLPPLAMPTEGTPVVMYATKHCPVCIKARRWLLEQKIPYVEKDMDSDQAAAAALQQKAAAQGVPVRGVPVFDVMGRIIPGFDPEQILSILKQGAATHLQTT